MSLHRLLSKLGLAIISLGALVVGTWPKIAVVLANFGEKLTDWALKVNCW